MKQVSEFYAFDRDHLDQPAKYILISSEVGPHSLLNFLIGCSQGKYAFTGAEIDFEDDYDPFEEVLLDEDSRSFLDSL